MITSDWLLLIWIARPLLEDAGGTLDTPLVAECTIATTRTMECTRSITPEAVCNYGYLRHRQQDSCHR